LDAGVVVAGAVAVGIAQRFVGAGLE
jgi:hypothetical protein